jgi:hypothetical protein
MADEFFTGWNPLTENRKAIRDSAVPFEVAYGDYTAPEEIDPRALMKHNNQGNMGSCQGFSLTNCGEYLYTLATGLKEVGPQFSQLFAYLESQRQNGLLGRDSGSTIESGLKVAETIGFLPLEDLPYSTPYPRNASSLVTQAMRQKAGELQTRSHSVLESYDEIFNYLASGVGAVHTGTIWNNSFYASSGVLDRVSMFGGGGHATAWLGYSKRKDSKGRNYIWRLNSHQDSWVEMAPSVIDALCAHNFTVVIGISDMKTPKPRDIDWAKERVFG